MRKLGLLFVFGLSAVVLSSLGNVREVAAQATPTVKSSCAVGSLRPLGLLLREKIKAQYIAAGHKNVFAFVGIKQGRSQLTPVTFANIQGISGVTVSADGSTVQIGAGTTPVELACNMELSVLIKVSYLPAGSQGPRKTVSTTQKMNFSGYLR
jgi:hypothetical protein